MKKHGVVAIGAFVIVVALVFLGMYRKAQAPAPENSIGGILENSPAREIQKESIKENGNGYSIEVAYPKLESAAASKYISDFAKGTVDDFKKDTAWQNDPSTPKTVEETSLNVDYNVTSAPHTISYIFTVSSYTGGAHGLTTTKTFIFDAFTAELLTLANIFIDEKKGLEALAVIATEQLTTTLQNPDATWIAQGAGPTEDNYQNIVFTKEGMQVFFDPYQVAPYVYGPQTVIVPYSALKNVLLPEFSR